MLTVFYVNLPTIIPKLTNYPTKEIFNQCKNATA